jgi:hypothetical protein
MNGATGSPSAFSRSLCYDNNTFYEEQKKQENREEEARE